MKSAPCICLLPTGLHKLCHPTIRDGSTWGKFGARVEQGDVFLFSNLGALSFSENRAPILTFVDVEIKIFIAVYLISSPDFCFIVTICWTTPV